MKKFTGEVASADSSEIYLRRKLTHLLIRYPNNDAPTVEIGTTVEIKSDTHFGQFTETYNAYGKYGGPLRTRKLRGHYYVFSDDIKEMNA